MKRISNTYNLNIINFKNDSEIIEAIFTLSENKLINFIYFANYTLLDKDTKYLSALKDSNLILLDGIGMQLYFKALNNETIVNNNGTDLLPKILNYCKDKSIPIAFYGSTKSNIEKCYKNNLDKGIYYYQDGYSPLDWDKIQNESVLFVGKGSPIQEIWQQEEIKCIQSKNIIVIGVGGFFDFCSGYSSRAPLIVKTIKLEWLYRLLLNPRQHYKKNYRNLLIFKYIFHAFFYGRKIE